MKNMWPEGFSENEKISPRQMFEEQSKLLPKLTGDLVHAEIYELGRMEELEQSLKNDFSYSFNIKGKFLEKYSFRVLSFSHDITLYPVLIRLDEVLGKELKIPDDPPLHGPTKEINEPEQLEKFLSSILKSERLTKIIGSIMALSK